MISEKVFYYLNNLVFISEYTLSTVMSVGHKVKSYFKQKAFEPNDISAVKKGIQTINTGLI